MACGIMHPNGFGPCYPEGHWLGWEEQLLEYRNSTMPDHEKEYFNRPDAEVHSLYVLNKLHAEPWVDFGGDYPIFGPIDSLEVPKLFATKSAHASLGSLIFLDSSLFAVDQALKDIIEHTEPNTHFFAPIKIIPPKKRRVQPISAHDGAVHSKSYFFVIIRRYVDCFAPNQSDPESFDAQEISYSFRHYHMSGLVLRKPAIANAHLWRDRKVFNVPAFFSDQIVRSIKSAGLRIPKLHKFKEA
jgi:hypothetical protein